MAGRSGNAFVPKGMKVRSRRNSAFTCGSDKLSKGYGSIGLRRQAGVFAVVTVWLVLRSIPITRFDGLFDAGMVALVRAVDILLALAAWSWLVGAFLGERARTIIAAAWIGAFRLVCGGVQSLGTVLCLLLKRLLTK